MVKKKKCYIYTRVSTAIQVDGYSLDVQKDKLRKYAEYQDMTIASEFSDELDLTKAESKAAYIEIKEYVLEKYRLKVS